LCSAPSGDGLLGPNHAKDFIYNLIKLVILHCVAVHLMSNSMADQDAFY
jgi:hypothetical protein